MKKLFIIVFILILSSCIQEDIDFHKKGDGSQISIYLVKDGQLDHTSTDVYLEELELENAPWLSHSEIKFYDWSSQMFYLKSGKEREKYSGKYFVVKSGQEPLFLGLFLSSFSSFMPMFPSIIAHDDLFFPSDVVGLGGYGTNQNITLYSKNSEFRIAMENSGLLKEGIDVELTGLTRDNSSTLKYTFKVTNLDSENIYILDPNKMGDSRFHYYTNGVGLRMADNHYWANDFDVTASESIKTSWYYKLAPGKSMVRTVKQNGYDSLPTGEVMASFSFPGANIKNSGEWKKPDGRVWLGSFRTEKEMTLR